MHVGGQAHPCPHRQSPLGPGSALTGRGPRGEVCWDGTRAQATCVGTSGSQVLRVWSRREATGSEGPVPLAGWPLSPVGRGVAGGGHQSRAMERAWGGDPPAWSTSCPAPPAGTEAEGGEKGGQEGLSSLPPFQSKGLRSGESAQVGAWESITPSKREGGEQLGVLASSL